MGKNRPIGLALSFVVCIGVACAAGIAAIKYPTFMQAIKIPAVATVFVAAFAFLTFDRLRDMASRIEKADERSIGLWQAVLKEIQDVASQKAESTVSGMQERITKSVDAIDTRLQELVRTNPWLRTVNPDIVPTDLTSLEPIHQAAEEVLDGGNKKDKEVVRRWIAAAIVNPNVQGSANDFHNIGVMASRDLDDDLLALRIYDRYLAQAPEPSPDILADVLQVATRVEDRQRGEKVASDILAQIDAANPRFTMKWRPWVFLADYYVSVGKAANALALLERGAATATDPDDVAHIRRNRASLLASLGRPDEAEKAFSEIVAAHPAHVPSGISFVYFLWSRGRTSDALARLDEVAARGNLNPNYDDQYKKLTEIRDKLQGKIPEPNGAEDFLKGLHFALRNASAILDAPTLERLVDACKKGLQQEEAANKRVDTHVSPAADGR